jgi:hypothetical protein
MLSLPSFLLRARVASLGVGALMFLACELEPLRPVDASSEPVNLEAASDIQAAVALEPVVRFLAKALGDPALRDRVYASMQGSPVRERKLHFRRFLESDGRGIQDRMTQLIGGNQRELVAALDALPPLEFYMPVPEHRRVWAGGSDLIVVGQLGETHTPLGFDLLGVQVNLSLSAPPKTPVLVVVPIETDFEEVSGSTAETKLASAVAQPSPTTPWDFRLASVNFGDDYEPWTKGDPEFEMHVFASNKFGQVLQYEYYDVFGNLRLGFRFWGCIGEEAGGDQQWNYDAWGAYRSYTGEDRPVLATDTDQNNYMDGYLTLAGTENDDPNACGDGGAAAFPSYGNNTVDDDDKVFTRPMPRGLENTYFEYYQGANRVWVNFGLRANLN